MLVVVNWVVALSSHEEIGGDELSSLVKQLVEGVLGVGGRFTEQDRASGVLDIISAASDCLSIRLHGQLLEVGREPVKVLVKTDRTLAMHLNSLALHLRRDKVRLSTEEVRVPHAQQTTEHWNILLEGSLLEVLVHGVGTSKELMEVVEANV